MQTATTQRAVKARTKAPAPFSATAAKLITQIQAEAREQLLAELSAKDAIVVLHGFDAETKRSWFDGNRLHVRDERGNHINMWRRHVMPEHWRNDPWLYKSFSPAHWQGSKMFVDASGKHWETFIGNHVCDDFGNLVQVAE